MRTSSFDDHHSDDDGRNMFRPFPHKSPGTKEEEQSSSEDEGSNVPSDYLTQKSLLPPWIDVYFPRKLLNTPLEDIDSFYEGRKTFVVITKGRRIFRFDATNAYWILSPLNPIRRLAISTFMHSLFILLMVAVILATCFFMIVPETPTVDAILSAFTVVYTIEVIVKVTAMGFILRPFTYLRDPWNCLDFVLTILAYTPIGLDVGGWAALRGLRLFEAFAFTKYTPGINTFLSTIKESVKNMASVIVFVAFFVFLFALSGMHHFMGILTQKCIAKFPDDGSWGNLTDESWANFVSNSKNWFVKDKTTPVCSNISGGGTCETGYICLEGYGTNPNYGFTSFDTFGWAFLSTFQLLTQDYWDNLCRLVLRAGGPWQILFFIPPILFGSYYLQALTLDIIATAYSNVKWKAEEYEAHSREYSDVQRRLPCPDDSNPATPIKKEDLSITNTAFHGAVKVINFLCVWDCCSAWEKFRQIVSFIVFDPFAFIFFALCIIVDTVLMALHHHGMNEDLKVTLESGNYFFTIAFAVEVVMKITAMHPKHYFQKKSNVFEFVIITLSVLELGFGRAMTLSVLRTFRLLKFIKSVLRMCPTSLMLLHIREMVLTPLINLMFVFSIVLIVFTILGMRLFGRNYIENIDRFAHSELPRWNFTDFLHSFMIVFRAFFGEWIEAMWDCMLVADVTCVPYFLSMALFGRFVIFNVFLALLLETFGNSNLSPLNENKIEEAIARINRVIKWIKSRRLKYTDRVSFRPANETREMPLPATSEHPSVESLCFIDEDLLENAVNIVDEGSVLFPAITSFSVTSILEMPLPAISEHPSVENVKIVDEDLLENAVNIVEEGSVLFPTINSYSVTNILEMPLRATREYPSVESLSFIDEDLLENAVNIVDEEMPLSAINEHPAVEKVNIVDEDLLENVVNIVDEGSVREGGTCPFCVSVYDTKYFEIAVGVVIIISSLALTFEDVQLQHRPTLQLILYNLHIIITVAFFSEILIRCLGLGLRQYFNSPFRLFDFIIVVCCFIYLITPLCGYREIRVLKTVRILRLLRILPRKKPMNVIINSLVKSVPVVCNALFLSLITWLTFAILGVRLFAGKYFKCVYINGTKISFEIIPDLDACVAKNYTWQNSNKNFDNLGNAYLSLLHVATFEGWIQIVNDAVDSRGIDQQPIRDANIYMYLYFDVFIVFSLVFTLSASIGVIYHNFRQQYWLKNGPFNCMCIVNMVPYNKKKMKSCKPVKAIPRPQWKLQARIYDTVQSGQFGMIFMLMIGLNMLTLTMYHYRLNETFGTILNYTNLIFLAIFTAECVLKMLAFRHRYFKDPWNLFDLAINLLIILALTLPNGVGLTVATLSLLRIIRVAKIGRLLRQLKRAKDFRKLLFIMSTCFPTLFHIILLHFVMIFIFAIFGMSFFMHVKERNGLDDMFNFKTFGQSVMVLIQVSTLASWAGVLDAITNEENCKAGDCGDSTLGTAFLLSYLFITYLIIVMYFPVVSLMYNPNEVITGDDYALFIETWQQFDPDATSYIQLAHLSDFLDALDPPFQIRKPNKFKIISHDIPIVINERVYFSDVLQAVVIDVLQREDLWYDEVESLSHDDYGQQYVSSTYYRQFEMHKARIIQKWWRKHKNNQYFESSEDNEGPMAHETSVQVESDGITTKNGHVIKLHNRTPTFNSHLHIADL